MAGVCYFCLPESFFFFLLLLVIALRCPLAYTRFPPRSLSGTTVKPFLAKRQACDIGMANWTLSWGSDC